MPEPQQEQQQAPWLDYAAQQQPKAAAATEEHGPWEDYGSDSEAAVQPVKHESAYAQGSFQTRKGGRVIDPNETTGPLGSLKRTFVDFPKSIYHSFADAATPEEQEHFNNLAKEENAPAHTPGSFELGYYRNVEKPSHDIMAAGERERNVGAESFKHGNYLKGANQYLSGVADTALGATPVAGPFIHSVAERIEPALTGHPEEGDFYGGMTDIATAHALENAKAIRAKISEAREPARIEAGQKRFNEALDVAPGKRGEKAAQMKEDVRVATKDLAAIEKDAPSKTTWLLRRGKGADSFHDLAEKIDARQDEMWEKGHAPGIARHAEAAIDENRIVNAGQSALTKMAARANPGEAETAMKWLSEQKQPTTLKEADELIRYINDDLKAKGAETRYGPLSVSVRQAVVRALRSEVERVLDASGEKGVKQVNRRWGALDNIKSRLRERAVQEARREAKAGPLPDWAHAYAFLHPDMGVTVGAGVAAAKMLAPNMSSKLTSAMRNFGKTSLEAPYEATPPVGWDAPRRALLNDSRPPAVEAPYRVGADTSGLLSREQQQGRWTTPRALLDRFAEERPNRLLPAPPHGEIPINAGDEVPARSIAVEPARHAERSAKGKMQRVYEGVEKHRVVGMTADGGPIYEHTPAIERSEQAISHEPIDKIRAKRGSKERGVKGGSPAGEERRSSIRDTAGPDFMRTARANQLRGLLADPSLPDTDRSIIEAQLEDLRAHPFEKHEGGDINSMKKERRLTREEAETSSKQRKEGRKKRFEKERK